MNVTNASQAGEKPSNVSNATQPAGGAAAGNVSNITNQTANLPPNLPQECVQRLGQILIEEDICANVDRYNRTQPYIIDPSQYQNQSN